MGRGNGGVNSLGSSNAIERFWSGPTLTPVLAWCSTAPSPYLNHWWHVVINTLWHSPESNLQRELKLSFYKMGYTFRITAISPIGECRWFFTFSDKRLQLFIIAWRECLCRIYRTTIHTYWLGRPIVKAYISLVIICEFNMRLHSRLSYRVDENIFHSITSTAIFNAFNSEQNCKAKDLNYLQNIFNQNYWSTSYTI